MGSKEKMNILISFDDTTWHYTRHAAVTILSLLETNKKHKIKIYVISSYLPQENIDELKRIVKLYKQEIEFIIEKNIVPKHLKNVIINQRSLTRGARYRYFFPKYIKNIDRILYLDCDVLIMKDITNIYNMNMDWKSIAWYLDNWPFWERYRKNLELDHYINSWVLLFDVKKYNMNKINVKKIKDINKKYSKYFWWCDQDKINVIFKDDFFITDERFNYQVSNKWFNKWIRNASIIHCLQKPRKEYDNIPVNIKDIYIKYLNLTKWKWYPEEKANYWYLYHIHHLIHQFLFHLLRIIVWKTTLRYHH